MSARILRYVLITQFGLVPAIVQPVSAEDPSRDRFARDVGLAYQGPGHTGSPIAANADGLIDVPGGPFDAQGVLMLSWVSLTDFGPFVERGNDCWGYVSASGREYALMGLDDRMSVVEITDPVNPVIIGSILHDSCLWGDVKVYQDTAYVVTDTNGCPAVGIQVVDLSDVDNGNISLIRTIPTPSRSHNVAVDTDSGFLYTSGSSGGSGTNVIFDLADPTNPVEVGVWTGHYQHDVQIVTYSSGPYAGREVMFGGAANLGAIDIIDVTDKNNTFLISSTPYPGAQYCHQVWTEDLQYLYVNDELDAIPRTTVFDITTLENPVYLGDFTSSPSSIDHNLYLRDGLVYEANYTSGLRIFCTDDPVNAVQVGWFDSHPESESPVFSGAWSTYPYFPSGNVIVSDIDRGLFVVDVSAALAAGSLTYDYPSGRPDTVDPEGGTTILVDIAGVCGATVETTTAMLHYDTGGGFAATPLTHVSGGSFNAVFPAVPCGQTVSYYVSASTAAGLVITDPVDAPASVYTALAVSSIDVLVADDIEVDTGWTAGDAGDTATTGIWTRVDPNGTAAQPEDDHTPDPGTVCYVTGQGTVGGGIGENDIDGGFTTLTTPLMDVTDAATRVGYWRWYVNNGNATVDDIFIVDISNDDGANWTNVETLGPVGPGTTGGWVHHEFVISNFVAASSQVKLRFVAADIGGGSIVEAAIDDLRVFVPVCDALPGIPTVSEWGVATMTILLLIGGTIVFRVPSSVTTRSLRL